MSDPVFLTATQVLIRYGKDTRKNRCWLWRRERDPKFPRPLQIGGRKMWILSDLEAFEAAAIVPAKAAA